MANDSLIPGRDDKPDISHDIVLYLEELSVSFDGFKALDNLTLYLNAGELRCIIGPNGSGKTTLIRTMAGLLSPVAGSIRRGPPRSSGPAVTQKSAEAEPMEIRR